MLSRFVAVLMVGILLGIGYAVWQYCGTSNAGAAEEKESTGEEKEEKIEWGKETRGQVANLRALRTEVKSGEPIEFEIRVKNVSNRDVGLPSGRADEKMSPCFWMFYFDQWEWRSAQLGSRIVPLKPGETVSVRLPRSDHERQHDGRARRTSLLPCAFPPHAEQERI